MANQDAIKTMLEELKNERASEQQAIQQAVKDALKSTPITLNDLSTDLRNTIMAKPTTSTPSGTSVVPQSPIATQTPTRDTMKPKSKTFKQVVDDLILKNNVYLYGKAGTGKTVLAKQVAEFLHTPITEGGYGMGSGDAYYILNCSQWTSPIQIIGGFSIKGYEEGQLEKAWRNGGVLILDELPKLDPNTAGLLNDALSMSADEGAKLTNGKGDKIVKHPDFMVVGAGNTDMKSTSVNFSGNNRQDYSLVDRFSGSMYQIEEDPILERSLTYTAIYNIAEGLRAQLPKDSIEAITLRSMLNFNRVYQMQMLRLLDSPMAFYPVGTTQEQIDNGTWLQSGEGKTLKDSIMSFINSLGKERAENMIRLATFKSIEGSGNVLNLETILLQATEQTTSIFEQEFKRLTGFNVKTGKNDGGVLWNASK